MQNQLQRKLARLRGKVKVIQTIMGVGKLALAVIGLIAFTYLIDRTLRLPVLVRSVLLVAALGTVVLLINRWLVRPIGRRYGDADLAGGVESLHPDLRDRLRSTLDFQRALTDGDFPESRVLAEKVVNETLAQIQPVSFRRVARMRRATPWVLGGVIATVALSAWAGRTESHFSVWFQRCVLLDASASWPRSTSLRVLMPPEGGAVYVTEEDGRTVFNLAKGLDFTVNVVADQGDPSEVAINFTDGDTQRGSTRLMPRVQPSRYTTTFDRLTRSFTFHVTGGDDDDMIPPYTVRVHNAPAVRDLHVDASFPPHARREPARIDGGDIEVPADTLLTIRMKPTMKIMSAHLVITRGEAESERIPVAPGPGGTYVAKWRASEDFEYGFHLVGENRITNHDRLTFRVLTLPDLAPTVKTVQPRAEMVDVAPEGIVPLLALLRDDYGVATARLIVGRGKNETTVPVVDADRIVSPDDGDVAGDRGFFVFKPLALATLKTDRKGERPPGPGDVIRLVLEAEDNHTAVAGDTYAPKPNAGRSRELKIEVLRKSDLERRINDRQLKIKEEARKALAYLDRVMGDSVDLTSLLTDAFHSEGPTKQKPTVADVAEQILSVERRQNRLSSDVVLILMELQKNVDAYVYNKLEDSPVNQRMLDLFARETRQKPGDDAHRFRVLLEEHGAGRLGQSDVVGKLVGMTQHAMTAGAEASPAAGRAMGRARASGKLEAMLEELKSTVTHQKRARAALAELVAALSEWEDYQEVIQISKQLIELQKDIEGRTINLIKKSYPGSTPDDKKPDDEKAEK